jgi:RNA polymerase sigma-70 factor (ECF subfamily)
LIDNPRRGYSKATHGKAGYGRQGRVTSQLNSETMGGRTPAEIIAHVLAGESQLFHDLIRPVERAVYVMLFMLLRSESDAEDAAQEAFIKVYRNLHSFRGESRFSTWVLSIARNEGLAWLRKRSTRPEEPLETVLDESSGDFTPAMLTDWREVPLEALERKELRQCLSQAVLHLPPIYREIVQLRDIEERDVQETAEMLGITPGTVKVRLHRARIMLQKQLVPVLKSYAPSTGPGWRRLFGRHA